MRHIAWIAQSVEQGTEDPRVLGSIPSPGTKFLAYHNKKLSHLKNERP